MTSLLKSFFTRTVLYPIIAGTLFYYLLISFFSSTPDSLALPKMISENFMDVYFIKLPEKVGTVLFFYFFGYLSGLASLVFSLRKLSFNGFKYGILPGALWLIFSISLKITLIITNIIFAPAILLIDVIVSTVRITIFKRRESQRAVPNQFSFQDDLNYEESHRL